jgi:3-deoxy-D-manno-octulosonic-acid transferase
MWHGQGLLLPYIRPRDDIKVAIMVAKHIDGDIVHAAVDSFGMTTIRGAGAGRKGKDKGGFAALRECMKAVRNDTTIALTADIPPGPARKAGLGLVTLAKLTGRAILPCAVVTNNYLKLNTWSGFTLNLPFSKMVMTGGEQIKVPRHASEAELEAARQLLEESMNEVTARAYRIASTSERGIPSDENPVAYGLMLRTYVGGTRLLQPTAPLLLKYRERQGKEETGRTDERLGLPSAERQPGALVWLHAASVGEANAILHLIEKLMDQRPDLQILLTTGTVTSAKLARARLPEKAIHQYIPLDTPDFMKRFFDHWQPSVAILTESEIWPNLIREARIREVPLLLVNGRFSPRSFRRWRKRFKVARPLFSSLDLVLAQNDRYAGYFERLGSRNVLVAGNLKMDAPPPPADKPTLGRLKKAIGSRPVFLAASTHPGEEEIIAGAHRSLKKEFPDLLTIIVPRHPIRGTEICELLESEDLSYTQRTNQDVPTASQDIYVADTIGELGLFYDLARVSFIGGSLVKHGGQNPIEAIMHKSAVLTGPNVHNFEEAYATLLEGQACIEVSSVEDLTMQASRLFQDEKARLELVARAGAEADEMRGALDATLDALEAYLPPVKEKRRAS